MCSQQLSVLMNNSLILKLTFHDVFSFQKLLTCRSDIPQVIYIKPSLFMGKIGTPSPFAKFGKPTPAPSRTLYKGGEGSIYVVCISDITSKIRNRIILSQ